MSDPPGGDDRTDHRLDCRTVGGLALVALAVVGGTVVTVRFGSAFTAATLRQFFERAGPFAPLVFVLVQALQVVVAPVPGQVLAGVGGYLFGRLPGTTYSMIGVVLGSYVVFVLARRYGPSLAERFFGPDRVATFERFGEENGPLALFVFFLLPTFPDDALCAIAGLWDLRTRTFLALLVVGRVPSFFLAAHAGTSVESGALGQVGLVLTALAVAVLAVALGRDRIESKLAGDDSTGDPPGP